MTTPDTLPLVGPALRRGWRDLLRLRPLTAHPRSALVITRRGRLVDVIPPGDQHTLSDYLAWPRDIREVDMRERTLGLTQRLESCDSGHSFLAIIQITYQVAQPARIALEIEDALGEAQEAILAIARAVCRQFGVERSGAVETNLREALSYSGELRQRMGQLGLTLCRTDVTVEIPPASVAYADAIRQHVRERPLLITCDLPSSDSAHSFHIQISGSYYYTSRLPTAERSDTDQTTAIILQAARQVAGRLPPERWTLLAQALRDTLMGDGQVRAALAGNQVQLLQPSVHVSPMEPAIALAMGEAPASRALPAPEPAAFVPADAPAPQPAAPVPANAPALQGDPAPGSGTSATRDPARTPAAPIQRQLPPAAPPEAGETEADDDMPDWMRLRQRLNEAGK